MTDEFIAETIIIPVIKDFSALFAITTFVLMIGAICMALDTPAIPV